MEALCAAAWDEISGLPFATFAVRAKRSDKSFPTASMEIDRVVGRFLLDKLLAAGRATRVQLKEPDLTVHIEVTPVDAGRPDS